MKKKLLLIIFNLFFTTVFSQNIEIEVDYEIQGYFKDFNNFDMENLKSKNFKHILNELNEIDKVYEREIDFDVFETKYDFEVKYLSNKSVHYLHYEIKILKEKDSIIGLICYENVRKKIDYYFDYEEIQNIIEKHNDFYVTKSDLSDFVNGFTNEYTYGYACGNSPKIEKTPSYNGYKYNDKRNLNEFRKLLKSYNIENQNYGLDAIEFLNKSGKIKLNEDDRKIIEHIKKRNSLLNTCSGCNVGIFEKRF